MIRYFFLATLLFSWPASAQDVNWLGWCCGIADCGIVDASAVKARIGGYEIRGRVRYHSQVSNGTGNKDGAFSHAERVDEQVPYSEVKPSPDGAYWRCKLPNGKRRCFFAPPPNT